jgi:hypothetical protein
MRLDHVSYVASHDQISDVVQRIGSQIGTAFVDGGIHPRFGTRNFTAPLLNGQYIEVVCPLEHPAAEQTPWGKAVNRKARDGGGWLTWVFSTPEISDVEQKFGRKAVEGHRTLPSGLDLKWKQIGVIEISDNPELPFFIEWLVQTHPSLDFDAKSGIIGIEISSKTELQDSWFRDEILASLSEVKISYVDPENTDDYKGIYKVIFKTPNGIVEIE